MKKIIVLSFVLFFTFSCQKNNSLYSKSSTNNSGLLGMLNMIDGNDSSGKKYRFNALASQNETEQKIIKTSYLTFETKSVEKTFQQINSLVKKYKGIIQNDNTYKGNGNITRSLVVRIPTNQFNTVIDSISKNIPVFDNKHIKLKNVTEEFIDLEARLKAKKALENRYLQLLAKAKDVKDMLEIEREVAKIREEIEAKQGRLNYLENQVSLSTLNIEFYETVEFAKSKSKSYFSRVGNALNGGFSALGNFILGLLYLWPFILIITILGVFIRRKLKRRKKK